MVRYSVATQGVLAIALWDHQAVEPEELSLRVGDVVHIIDLSDPDWWWAAASPSSSSGYGSRPNAPYGWIPASYVQLCEQPISRQFHERSQTFRPVNAHLSVVGPSVTALSTHSVRANVINELITAERDYVKLLSDLVDVSGEISARRCVDPLNLSFDRLFRYSIKYPYEDL